MQKQLCNPAGGWTLTDDICYQHVRKLGERTYELIEMGLMNPEEYLYEVYADTICLDDYGPDEIKNILAAFGYSSIREVRKEYKEESNQVIAECIFEYFGSFAVEPLACDISKDDAIRLIDEYINAAKLYTKAELLRTLEENGSNEPALAAVGDHYMSVLGEDPIWRYPLCDGKYLGGFVVPVQEGWAWVPYNYVDEFEYELLVLDDVSFLDAETCEYLAEEMRSYTDGFCKALHRIMRELQNKRPVQSNLHQEETGGK